MRRVLLALLSLRLGGRSWKEETVVILFGAGVFSLVCVHTVILVTAEQ